jgi:benzil reductase ((S)-benzoin forming)
MKITNKSLSIVTGATGGLGKSISKSILNSGGYLLFIGRDTNKINLFEKSIEGEYSDFFFKAKADLSKKDDLDLIRKKLISILKSNEKIKEIFLFNNASTIDPIDLIYNVSFENISSSLVLNVASAYSLSSLLININKTIKTYETNIINISSGVSINAIKGWSTYCISKAAMNMLSKCIAVENDDLINNIFSLSINPGAINTEMQRKIRNADPKMIPIANKFKNMYDEGELQEPEFVTEKLFRILKSKNYSNGDYIDFNKIA